MKPLRYFLFLLAAMAALFLPLRASAQSDYIRLHIVADSDSLHDQAVKLCVRDDVRSYTAELLKSCANAGDAWTILRNHEKELLSLAEASAARYGFSGNVSLDLGVFPFPDRTYDDELVPAGDYRALRITLGKGEGRNWWCVVYPSLCLPETADIDKPVEFYSSIYRWAVRIWEAIAK